MKPLASALFLLAGARLALAQIVPTITFDNASDLSNNFRQLQGPGTGTVTVATDSTPNGYANVLTAGTSSAYVSIYDTTPGNAADANPTFSGAFTLTLDISSANGNSSFGIYLFENGNPNNNLLTLFNLETTVGGSGNEQIRFWRDSPSIGTGAVGTPYTVTSGLFTGTGGTNDAGSDSYVTTVANRPNATIDTSNPFTFYPVTFTYDPTALTLRVAGPGGFSSTLAIPSADLIANPAIAVRISDPASDANSAKFDNFGVVPEPSAAILVLGGAGLLGLRRRRA